MRFGGAVACARKAHFGHQGRPGQLGGSQPYGLEAQARDRKRGIHFFSTYAAAFAARTKLGPHTMNVIVKDANRGYYVAPAREVPRLHRELHTRHPLPRMHQPVHATTEMRVAIKSLQDEQLAFAEVYTPHDLDAQGEFMDARGVRDLAHGFMQYLVASGSNSIDVMHSERVAKVDVIASFVNDDTVHSPLYAPEAWVMGVHVQDAPLWRAIKAGDFTGFSFQALVYGEPEDVEVPDRVTGTTQPADNHTHTFRVQLDAQGRVEHGVTNPGPNGHVHVIRRPGRTESVDGHAHIFDLARPIARAA